jgi:hypothetical protein
VDRKEVSDLFIGADGCVSGTDHGIEFVDAQFANFVAQIHHWKPPVGLGVMLMDALPSFFPPPVTASRSFKLNSKLLFMSFVPFLFGKHRPLSMPGRRSDKESRSKPFIGGVT